MFSKIRAALKPPAFLDEERDRLARILTVILITLLFASLVVAVITYISGNMSSAYALLGGGLVAVFSLWLTRRGMVRLASFLVLLMFLIMTTFVLFNGNGIHDISIIAYPVVILLGSLLVRQRSFFILTGLCILSAGMVVFGEINGWLVTPFSQATEYSDIVSIAVVMGIMAVSAYLLSDSLYTSLERARLNERALAETNRQLEQQAEEIQASEARWRSLVENAPDMIMNVLQDGTIEYTNARGGSTAEVTGRKVYDFMPPENRGMAQDAIDYVFSTGQPTRYEILGYLPDGKQGWFSVRLSPVFHGDQVISLTLISTNVTERKKAEEEIHQLNATLEQRVAARTAELEAKNREMETFTYSVSHDLKAPLRGIDGYSRLLLDDYADRIDEDGQSFLRTIRNATEQMNRLIDDLLTYSRLERRLVSRMAIDLSELISSILGERSQELNDRNVQIIISLPCMHITAEPEGLAQALRNLLDNALKFTQSAAAPCIEIGGYETETACVLWIKDNGIGFDMQYHDRIFEIFQRLHRLEEFPGTGIGLALVRKVVQRIGGRVWAESVPGAGATFFLEIPK
ncbi:MAG: PAS domain S-box protein [Anaerolineales bacterium]|nr:PAS domain S-box protein [Anaerolineales bacterium]